MALAPANSKRMPGVATHASHAIVHGSWRSLAGRGQIGMTALAIGGLLRPWAQGMVAVTGVAIRGFYLFPAGVDATVGAGFILLFLGEMAISAQL